jgi:hypothetical protein
MADFLFNYYDDVEIPLKNKNICIIALLGCDDAIEMSVFLAFSDVYIPIYVMRYLE